MLTGFKTLQKNYAKYRCKIARRFLSWHSIEELFPNAEKLHPIPPETVATPEIKQMNCRKRPLQIDNYSLPDIYTAHLSQVIFDPKSNLIFTESGKAIEETKDVG
ncbi:hypothetical protein [Coleofasciculus sp.]|uniref:hypothetical protein n=1 Tax=Coleofasciculus sp. TaxID=3100458 RepID=UPI0039FA0EBC